jgi:protein-tyrosine phosphatase
MNGPGSWVMRRYGRKQGMLRHFYHLAQYRSGRYSLWQPGAIDWDPVERLVFVCAGNILRSPYAECVAARFGVSASSFGLQTAGGDETPAMAIRIAAERGVDLTAHRSRTLGSVKVSRGDLVLAMEPLHASMLGTLALPVQISLLGLFVRPHRPYVQDPFGLSEAYMRTCYDYLDAAVASLVEHWTRHGDGGRRIPGDDPRCR